MAFESGKKSGLRGSVAEAGRCDDGKLIHRLGGAIPRARAREHPRRRQVKVDTASLMKKDRVVEPSTAAFDVAVVVVDR
jgi:hypothetical protein